MIEGTIVRLRALEPSDAERAYEWVNDREVTQFLTMRYPMSHGDEDRWFAESSGNNGFARDVRLAIETKDGGIHIGSCGLHNVSPEDRHAELGIMIGDKRYWSKGHGTDAVRALVRFAFQQMNLHRVSLGVFEFNERAYACYRKCGFLEEGRFREVYFQDGRYHDIILMSVLRPEWEAVKGSS